MEQILVSVELAARLVGRSDRYIQKQIADGIIPAVKSDGGERGGAAGQVYRIPLDVLPYEAQILYYSSISESARDTAVDLVAYKHKHGDDGLRELLKQQQIVRAADGLRKQCTGRNLQGELEKLATENGITMRTLYRWEKAYSTSGIGGLMRK
ncbi:MAG: hypothetical protein RSG96_01735, partial [Clostridia bacterium]